MEYQDYYATLGVPGTRHPGRDQEGLPQARAAAPSRTATRATRPPKSASRRSTRPTTSCRTPRSASATTSWARLGGVFSAPARGGAAGRAVRPGGPFAGFGGRSARSRRRRRPLRVPQHRGGPARPASATSSACSSAAIRTGSARGRAAGGRRTCATSDGHRSTSCLGDDRRVLIPDGDGRPAGPLGGVAAPPRDAEAEAE